MYKLNKEGTDVEPDDFRLGAFKEKNKPSPIWLYNDSYDPRKWGNGRVWNDNRDYYGGDEAPLLINMPKEMEKRWDKEILKALGIES